MAMDMFLKLEKPIPGESQDKDKDKVGDIEILAWSWGLSQSGSFHTGAGGGAGKANIQDLSLTKYFDNASATLMGCCTKGTHMDKATLSVRKAGDKPYVYIKITMEHVLVSSISTGGSGGEDRLTENLSLNFGKVKVEYFKQDNKTGAVSAGTTMGWDIQQSVAT